MKHVFHLIPRGSSNTMVQDTSVGDRMKKHWLLILLLGVLMASSSLGYASAGVEVNPGYLKPGENVELVFTGPPGESLNVTVIGSRGALENITVTLDPTGQYTWDYRVNETVYTDSLRVLAMIGDSVEESGFIVSHMSQSQLSQTMNMMAANSRKQAETAMIEAKRDGTWTAEMYGDMREAVQLLEESREHAESGKHNDAFEAISEALDRFESIITKSYPSETTPPQLTDDEKALIRAKEAQNQLEKAKEQLETTARNLKQKGFNTGVLEENIKKIEDALSTAGTAIENRQLAEAQTQLQTASEINKRVQNQLNERLEEIIQPRVQEYQTSLQNRYNTMKDTLNTMQTVAPDLVEGIVTDLDGLESELTRANELYMEGDYTQSIRVLQSVDNQFKKTLEGIDGRETRQLVNSLDRLALRLENEDSPRVRQRIQREIENIETKLRDNLSVTPNRPQGTNTTPTRPQQPPKAPALTP